MIKPTRKKETTTTTDVKLSFSNAQSNVSFPQHYRVVEVQRPELGSYTAADPGGVNRGS